MDTITVYLEGLEKAIPIDAQPDPRDPGHFLIKNFEGQPLRGKLSMSGHAYNVMLLSDSYIIIDADVTELFKDSRSDDRVIFILPTDKPEDFYLDQYITGEKGQAPYKAIILRQRDPFLMISAVLYPRDLLELPTPMFMTKSGKVMAAIWKEKPEVISGTAAKTEHAHSQHEIGRILRAVRQQDRKPVLAPNAPKEEWF